ncbi:18070_t:CDS:2 [Funneliformis geosporum]|nr:18070_t:CDS:2 [Funneliformis geosporum]
MLILEDNNQLLFLWKEFGSDKSYVKKRAQGVEWLAFYCMLKKYYLNSNNFIQVVLGLNNLKIVNKLQKLIHERFLTSLKEKVTSAKKDDDIIICNNTKIQELVEKEIEEKKVGSTIFMRFNISCVIHYLLCKTSTQYTNEDSKVKYSYLVAEATLAKGINRNSFQTALATIGVTNQCSKQTYHNYQNHMYKPIIEDAKFSSMTILLEILDQLEANHLPNQEKILPVGDLSDSIQWKILVQQNLRIILQ